MNEIVICGLTCNDMSGVRNVDILTQKEHLGEQWDLLSEEEKESYLKSRKDEFAFNCRTGYSFVAKKDSAVIGFLFAQENLPFKDRICIRHIAVHPLFQRQGIGKKLFVALINKARREGKKAIRSSINPDNPDSIMLHRKAGFDVIDWKRAILTL